MKIGILHLTDIHLSITEKWLEDKMQKIAAAIKNDFEETSKIFIVITGDLTQSSSQKEYEKFSELLLKLISYLKVIYKNIPIENIILPGNHDCDFNLDSQARRNLIQNIDYESIGNDESVIENCVSVQKNFWTFYQGITNELPLSKLFYQREDVIGDSTIVFNCFNSSWMSSINEKPGSLFYPTKKLVDLRKGDLNISLVHHPLNWYNPNAKDNNVIEFREFIDNNSNVVLFAHEHVDNGYSKRNTSSREEVYYRFGSALFSSDKKVNNSGFKSLVIDLISKELNEKQYEWNSGIYESKKPSSIPLNYSSKNIDFEIKLDFQQKLNSIKIPLIFENGLKPTLSEIYVFPDLEPISTKSKSFNDFVDSENLINLKQFKLCFLEGDNQCGKTALLNMLYLSLYKKKFYPLLLDGSDVCKPDIESILEKAFGNQYNDKTYEAYCQYENNSKVLLIDNIQDCHLNKKILNEVIVKLQNRFSKIIFSSSLLNGIISSIDSEEVVVNYKIIPLGHLKRNRLIDNYHRINNKYDFCIQEQSLLDKVKYSFDQVQSVLGNKLMPSHPVFILTIIQTLQEAKPMDLGQTSYGYCYQSLITNALLQSAKVGGDLDTYMNFLTEFAFSLYETGNDSFSEIEFKDFYSIYSNKYIVPPFEEIKLKLLKSSILIVDESYFKFTYEYINYYLAARKISQLNNCEYGKDIIKKLCRNLHDKKQANILVFVAHHSKSECLIEEATLSSMTPFEGHNPVTLEKDDPYFNLIQSIIKDFCNDVIDESRKPSEERKIALEKRDRLDRLVDAEENNDDDSDIMQSEEIKALHQAIRALEIVGQIVKNGKGSIDKIQLAQMIEELYYTGFRLVSYFGDLSNDARDITIKHILKNIEEGEAKTKIVEKVNGYFQARALDFCLNVFSKVIYSVGCKDLRPIYDEVSKKINSPASKLVTFGIKLYYSKLSTEELKRLTDDFKSNPVAFEILKSNVKYYVYNNQIEFKDRQIIESQLHVKFTPKALAINKTIED